MTDKQKSNILEVLSHFISADNEFVSGELWLKHVREGERLFKLYFPERPEREINDLLQSCRSYNSELTHTSIMS